MRRRFINNHKTFDYSKYMTIEALEDGYEVYFLRDVEYNLNGHKWVVLKAGLNSPTLKKGDLLSLRCSLTLGDSFGHFWGNGKAINLRGNILSLIFKDDTNLDISGYYNVFSGTFAFYHGNNIVSVEKNFLPATTLAECCYSDMFQGCTALTTAPELPATALQAHCYDSMFQGCTALTTAPELPATALKHHCYQQMFCDCTSLTTAPTLPATILEEHCYYYMFSNCSKLNYIKMLATDISASDCLDHWVYHVASTGIFVKNPDRNGLPTGISGIPYGWTVVNDGEESGGDLHLTLNTTNDDNIKAFQLMESEKVENINGDFDWEPNNTIIYVSGQAGGGSFTNTPIIWANQSKNSSCWNIYFENMSEIGTSSVCFLHSNGLLEAFDDD